MTTGSKEGAATVGRSAVFLDRDGVLNEIVMRGTTVSSPRWPDELVVADDAVVATGRLAAAGFVLVVVTNQPDLSRGLVSADDLAEMHRRLGELHDIAGFYVCPHERQERCECRKPSPVLLQRAQTELHLAPGRGSWMIGDRWADVAAGQAAGVSTALLERPWSWEPVGGMPVPDGVQPDLAAPSILAIAATIIDRAAAPGS